MPDETMPPPGASRMLSVVVPLYNEELVIQPMCERLIGVLESIGMDFEVVMVDDGSRDRTLQLAREICDRDRRFRLLSFSRNFGHQIAITAGMDRACGDAVVVIDADLQDPPEVIAELVQRWLEGYQVVYGVRERREGESWFKVVTAKLFYRLLRVMTDQHIPVDTGDFRLIDRVALDSFLQMRERARFVRGMVSWVGFRQIEVTYVRHERHAGETKYPLRKMIGFALDGILSFSRVPLRLASVVGVISSMLAFASILYALVVKVFFPEHAIQGWSSVFVAVLFVGGIQLVCLGFVGEYVGRMYEEIKGRPLYIVQDERNFPE